MIFHTFISLMSRIKCFFEHKYFISQLGYCHKTAIVITPSICTCPQKLFFSENTNVYDDAKFIINPKGDNGKFIMKKNSGASVGLTIITGNHQRILGAFFKEESSSHINDIDKDVVIEEDVWIGANATILAGVTVGRGSTVGAGSVCVKNIPPYSIVMGNPAKIVGFNYSPEEIIEHERALYPEEERLPLSLLENNYKKFFLDRVSEIMFFIK